MPRGVHFTAQTAFRLPEGLLASLKGAAAEDERTMTDCVSEAIGEWLDRRNGITTRVTTVPEPAAAVVPPVLAVPSPPGPIAMKLFAALKSDGTFQEVVPVFVM